MPGKPKGQGAAAGDNGQGFSGLLPSAERGYSNIFVGGDVGRSSERPHNREFKKDSKGGLSQWQV